MRLLLNCKRSQPPPSTPEGALGSIARDDFFGSCSSSSRKSDAEVGWRSHRPASRRGLFRTLVVYRVASSNPASPPARHLA